MANHSHSKTVCFGELLLRLSTEPGLKYGQANQLDMIFGGSEANIAVSLSILGNDSTYITALPSHNLGETAIQRLRTYGVDTEHIYRDNHRIGIYLTELGAGMRSTDVIYDRCYSSFSQINTDTFDWDSIFKEVNWFHWSGISPALNANVTEVCLQAIQEAKKRGITVSADLNYRSKLW
ncbi:MAG: sugar kinase, partial [Bacteroidota bacterium]